MTGILDQIKRTTPETLAGVPSSFDDLPAPTYRPRVPRDMIRDVPGATDLRDAMPQAGSSSRNAGMVRTDGTGRVDTRPFADQVGLPTERQRAFIDSLMADLLELDASAWDQGMAYIKKMSANRAWDPSRGGNVSRWITSLKTRIAELRDTAKVEAAKPVTGSWARWRELAAKLAVVGGSKGTRFAVDTNEGAVNSIAFWRITPSRDGSKFFLNQVIGGQGAVKVRMSPEVMIAVAEKIIAAGPVEAMVRYGLELGECGHCGRELTNDVSRAAGIGPHCRKHMGGWN